MKKPRITVDQVKEIDRLLVSGSTPQEITILTGIAVKTIQRIQAGSSWSSVTGRGGDPAEAIVRIRRDRPRHKFLWDTVGGLDEVDRHNLRVMLGKYLAMDPNIEWFWGRFRAWDGVLGCISDGYIAWLSEKLCSAFQNLGYEELPTFPLAATIGGSTENKLPIEAVHPRYHKMLEKRGLVPYSHTVMESIVLLAKEQKDDDPIVHACVVAYV